jgi:hypothetical protein
MSAPLISAKQPQIYLTIISGAGTLAAVASRSRVFSSAAAVGVASKFATVFSLDRNVIASAATFS